MKTIGIAAHGAEGGVLCFITACREGAERLGPNMHPPVVMSAVPMALSMPAWESHDHATVAKHLSRSVQYVADAGADFYVCPNNTAHIVLEKIADRLPIPGLHIAEVVCHEIAANRGTRPGLLGTKWTMTGSVYAKILQKRGMDRLVPDEPMQVRLNAAIFDELCQGACKDETAGLFIAAIDDLKARGADCAILGCTEIPLVVTSANSPLPILDSTRLLAKYSVQQALDEHPLNTRTGWLRVTS